MMRIRSRMAAWTFAASLALAWAGSAPADEGDPEVTPIENSVRLDIRIAGLGSKGCKIEIKPAHPSCQFKAIEKEIKKSSPGEVLKLDLITVAAKSTGADRDCTFEIVVTEPGKKAKTFRRGLQLTAPTPGAKTPERDLRCHLLATAIASKDEDSKTKRR